MKFFGYEHGGGTAESRMSSIFSILKRKNKNKISTRISVVAAPVYTPAKNAYKFQFPHIRISVLVVCFLGDLF